MTTESEPGTAEARFRESASARNHARRAVVGQVRDLGGEITAQPVFPGEPQSALVATPAPADGIRAARAVEVASRGLAREYIRHAREAGKSWHEIGGILALTASEGDTIADAAFAYAVGVVTRTYTPWFSWRCPSCHGTVRDRGPCSGPADDEPGHAADCERLAADVAAWLAQW